VEHIEYKENAIAAFMTHQNCTIKASESELMPTAQTVTSDASTIPSETLQFRCRIFVSMCCKPPRGFAVVGSPYPN